MAVFIRALTLILVQLVLSVILPAISIKTLPVNAEGVFQLMGILRVLLVIFMEILQNQENQMVVLFRYIRMDISAR